MKISQVITKRQFSDFIHLGDIIHRDHPQYIAPIKMLLRQTFNRKKNPFWEKADYVLFVAYSGNQPVGRIAAICFKTKQEGHFGFFDCINDFNAALSLINAVKRHFKEKNIYSFTGPLNPSINYELGVLDSGFEQQAFFMMNYNPPYYGKLLQQLGAKEEMSFSAFEQPCGIRDEKITRVCRLLKKRYPIKIDEIDYSNYDNEAKKLCRIYNDAFINHWGYDPFTEKEFVYMARSLKSILNRRLLFTLSFNGEPVAFILAVPNLNEAIQHLPYGKFTLTGLWKFFKTKQKIKWVKVMVIAVKQKYQHLGLGSILYAEMASRVEQEGYLGGEISWVATENLRMNKIVMEMGAKKTKEYKIYRF
ncbi:MAG: GNAT family N-acetyltransferase [Bacteroidetes bacterium]|nr:GNAT family N-acetyltransferase [Bacteroidota bacterium]HET6245135.1 GNAT family N-acetyltransferase [Bacteroidia bacterium]